MKTNKILVFFLAILVAVFAVNTVMAAEGDLSVDLTSVIVNDVEVVPGDTVTAGYPGETVPLKVKLLANDDLDNVKVRAWIDGYKNDISVSTSRFDILNESTYLKRLSLTLPSVNDLDDVDEDLTLHVRVSDKNDYKEEEYTIRMQRESYVFRVLSVEAPTSVAAGDIVGVDVVLKNIGAHEMEDAFVTARIPELGVSRKVYFGDLTPIDDEDSDGKQDARERRIYLVIPSDAVTGVYELEVKASNYDSTETVTKDMAVNGVDPEAEDDALDLDDKENSGVPNSIIVLTVILVIVFVVLLIVLIVLLTKKPEERIEDFGETSYY